jgi:hypothetical protein
MKDLGTKRENQFIEKETPDFPKVTYPKVDLPLSFIENKDVKKDDEVEIRLKGKLCGFEDNEWRKIVTFELKEGEIVGKDKKKEEESSLLG